MGQLDIRRIRAMEILDSRGNPTVAVEVTLAGGAVAEAQVPSGASTGTHEAVELRDRQNPRYGFKGVSRAVENVEGEIARALEGKDAGDQAALDRLMIGLDGTPGKSRLGANAILGVSCAAARASAQAQQIPLWRYLAGHRQAKMPVPMINIFSGGLHAGLNFEFQDFLAIPHGFPSYAKALEAAVMVHRAARSLLDQYRYPLTGVADEGGWGPKLPTNETAADFLTRSIERAGFVPGEQISIAIDAASSHFYRDLRYHIDTEANAFSSAEMITMLSEWAGRYPLLSLEDGLAEDDWLGWEDLTAKLGRRMQLVGDDLFTTNVSRLDAGIRRQAGNAVLVKMNQIGTLTETFEVIDKARSAGFRAVISARSGETEDSFLADLAVASGAGQIKVGSVTRSERLAKYNRLLWIERETGMEYPGGAVFGPLLAAHREKAV